MLFNFMCFVQVGDVDCDHCECVRAEKDNITPRPVIVVSPEKPGADMLSVASAAFSSAHAVLKTLPEHEALAKQCLKHATQLYKEAKANPGIYSDSNPILAKTYKNDHWEQFAYLAAAWLYAATGDDTYLKVCTPDTIQKIFCVQRPLLNSSFIARCA